ncbi:MAG: ROK family protein [Phycisphaerae bacterium]
MATYCIGIDLGGTAIKVGLLDDNQTPTDTIELSTPTEGADAVIDAMVRGARRAMSDAGVSPADVLGVGIGSPGPLSITEGTIHALPNIPGMDGCRLRDRVAAGIELPAVLENDANAAAYGEYLVGAGQASANMVMLTLGTGVGSGIIIDGRIVHGSHEIGGELGHMIVDPGGQRCGCGQAGCLEQYASATYIARYAEETLGRTQRGSSLAEVFAANGELTTKDINEHRKAGDDFAAEVWDRGLYYLAVGCVSICRVFDPDQIVLAGGLVNAGEDLMFPLREHFAREHWTLTEPRTELSIATLGSDAGMIGAAGVAWSAFGPEANGTIPTSNDA